MGLNNAATSRILVNLAVILILYTTANLYLYFCVNISSVLNTFHKLSLSCRNISLFKFLFHRWPKSQSASLP